MRYVRALTGDIKKTYPQLGDVAVDYAWSGTLGLTIHRMPQIGELGPGVWLASGFGGHGLNTTAMAGNIIARGDRRRRPNLAAVHAVRTGLGRRGVRARGGASAELDKRLHAAVGERRAKLAKWRVSAPIARRSKLRERPECDRRPDRVPAAHSPRRS